MNELNEDEKKYQIALTLIEGVGDVIAKKLLAFTSSAKAVFFAKRSELGCEGFLVTVEHAC